jgi:hypothetical protein
MMKNFEKEINNRLADGLWDRNIAQCVVGRRRRMLITQIFAGISCVLLMMFIPYVLFINTVNPMEQLYTQVDNVYENTFASMQVEMNYW